MPPPKHVVAACAVLVLLAACGTDGDGTPSGTPTATATATAAPSPSPSVPIPDVPTPTPSAEAAEKSYEGASAFVEYAIAVINRAYLTGDTKPLEEISTDECSTCQNMAETITKAYTAGGAFIGGQIQIREIETIGIAPNVVPTVETVLDVSELHRLNREGKVVATTPATESGTLLWDLSWLDAWSLAGIRKPST